MDTGQQSGKRARRREPAREKRITATLGKPLRARLRTMAAEGGVTDSQLVFTLVREALNARDGKSHPAPKTQARPSPGTEPATWAPISIEEIERALAAIPPLVVDASTSLPRARRRRRRRSWCCTCHR